MQRLMGPAGRNVDESHLVLSATWPNQFQQVAPSLTSASILVELYSSSHVAEGQKDFMSSNSERDSVENERRFRVLVEGIVDYAIYMLSPSGIVVNWNAGAARIKGYQADEIVGQHFSVFYPSEDRKAGLPKITLDTARSAGKFEAEGWRVRKDGSRFLASVVVDAIYENGSLIGFAEITRDITERRTAEAKLNASESNFRLLVSGVTDYALYMLSPNGLVTNWNAGGQRIKGYTPDEIIGQHFSKFYTEADRASGKPDRALATARDKGRYEEEGWRVRKDGSFFWASVVIDPIHDDLGDLIGFAKITRDITERKEAQEKLERVQRQLAESQKLDALGQLTGGVAHDFNNLLMVISGGIHVLKKAVADNSKAMRAAEAIENATKRGASLTSQLLSFARRQSVNPAPLSLPGALASIYEVLTSGLGSSTKLRVETAADLWPVTVDHTEFETAIINLVINARDAMPNGGEVVISAINIITETDDVVGEHVAISVEDTGQGIPPDVLDKVFDPFFTTKPVGKGTGLGLSQVHGFVHQAGGAIKVTSELGKGTVVTISLPRGSVPASTEDDATMVANASTVLLVEDNPEVADVSKGLLEQLGYEVRWASNAEAAIAEMERNGIKLVFSDIVMPGKMDGISLAKVIRSRHPTIPILLATGYSEAASKVDNEFPILRKPFAIHELSQALAKISK